MPELRLPRPDRSLEIWRTGEPRVLPARPEGPWNRVAFAAAHIVHDPLADHDPWLDPAIDFEATLRWRHHLWDLGLGVAEAMDTAQRGSGLDWPAAQALIAKSVAEARGRGDALLFSGCGTDHLLPREGLRLADILHAYEEQIGFVEGLGGRVILMASRALAATARGAEDYVAVYTALLRQVSEPVIIHWLGEMFDPALEGYFGARDHWQAMETLLAIIAANAARIDGVKVSLLSAEKEIALRRRLPPGVRMYTGDDFNYAELIAGDEQGHSDALLGIFDAIAPVASAALAALARGERERYFALFEPTVPLSRHIFRAPTRFYKTGIVFLAWLNGHQSHFTMVGGQESARSLLHLAELFRLADRAGLLRDPELACSRMRTFLAIHGVAQD